MKVDSTKGKAAPGGNRAATNSETLGYDFNPKMNPLTGWYALAKPSRNRQQKRTWKRGNRGQIDIITLVELALVFVIVVLLAWWAQL